MREILFDIETTGLEVTSHIHCIGLIIIDDGVPSPALCYTSRPIQHSDGSFDDCLAILATADRLITFNGISFDIPVMQQFFRVNINAPDHLDLLILTKIMFTEDQLIAIDAGIPSIPKKDWGSFSLRSFSIRIGTELKGDHSDWTTLTSDMVLYCKQDTVATYTLYQTLLPMPNYPLPNVIQLEHQVAKLISDQVLSGFYFDITSARSLYTRMLFERGNIERALLKTFTPRLLPDGPVQKTNKLIRTKLYIPNQNHISTFSAARPFKRPLKRFKSGKLKLPPKKAYKWFATPHSTIIQEKEGEYQNIVLTKFSATDAQIKTWLKLLYNFEFSTYTAKGNVKVDREDLLTLGKDGENLRRLIKLKKDISQLGGTDNSLISQYNPLTHSIHGRVDTIGAATHRCLPLSYKIKTAEGYKEYSELKEGDLIYNYINNKEGLSRVKAINVYTNAVTHLIRNDLQYFECTLDHQWITPTGKIATKDINENTLLLL